MTEALNRTAKAILGLQTFDNDNLDHVRAVLNKHLAAAEAEIGVHFKIGRISYRPTHASTRLEMSIKHGDHVVRKEEEDFKRLAFRYGLEESDLGRSFQYHGESYKVTGLSARAKKYPILAANAEGKEYKFPASTVKEGLGK